MELQPRVIEVRHAGECFRCRGSAQSDSTSPDPACSRRDTRDAVLTIPKRTSLADARSFAERQAAWIGARLRRLPETVYLVSRRCHSRSGRANGDRLLSRRKEASPGSIYHGHQPVRYKLCASPEKLRICRDAWWIFCVVNAAAILSAPSLPPRSRIGKTDAVDYACAIRPRDGVPARRRAG